MCGNPRKYFGQPTRQELLNNSLMERGAEAAELN
jgi:hypothetical protein